MRDHRGLEPQSREQFEQWMAWRQWVVESLTPEYREIFKLELDLSESFTQQMVIAAARGTGSYGPPMERYGILEIGEDCPEPRDFGDYLTRSNRMTWEGYRTFREHILECSNCADFVYEDCDDTVQQVTGILGHERVDLIVEALAGGDLGIIPRKYGSCF